ncbi:hypothetical protein M8C21_029886 [Ambrosia artemisiifolia]|uniref:non-specific serine/threonine protein kinase n=1 Tax=Ambrosia artemisiifolia TaxID=4212 RepID=A0AAD5G5V7_AMBAR|nr:hypothetical protein M8C21_029886 [Ambrosia artemisiifolia]
MGSEVGFLMAENHMLEKLKLESKPRPEIEDPDVVERCPNNRYVRYNELLGRGAFKTVYKGFDEVEGIEVAWNQVMLDDAMQSPEHLERVYSEGIKPAGLSKVKDPQVKEFIEKCLVPLPQRLPAKELLNDPFLAPESIKEYVHEPVQFDLVNLPTPNSSAMDIDCNDHKISPGSSCIKSDMGIPCLPSHELQCLNERNDIRLKGEKNEDNSVMLTLRIADFSGSVRNIHFPFYLDSDTAHIIAQEMVEQLDLLHEDVAVIAELIDDMILKFVPTWKPSFKKSGSSGGISSHEGSEILENGQTAFEPTKVPHPENNGSDYSSSTYSDDWMKSTGTITSDSIPSVDHCEKDVCEDLKQELDAIEARYHHWYSELQKSRDAAIEDAKRRWVSKKKELVI